MSPFPITLLWYPPQFDVVIRTGANQLTEHTRVEDEGSYNWNLSFPLL